MSSDGKASEADCAEQTESLINARTGRRRRRRDDRDRERTRCPRCFLGWVRQIRLEEWLTKARSRKGIAAYEYPHASGGVGRNG